MGISPKAAVAAAFTPRGSGKRTGRPEHHRRGSSLTGSVTPAAPLHNKQLSEEFIPQQSFQQLQAMPDFVPGSDFVPGQDFLPGQQFLGASQTSVQYNPYSDFQQQGFSNLDSSHLQVNPYAHNAGSGGAQPYFQNSTDFSYPLNYHLYAPFGPRRENLTAYQRSTADFFIPEDLRQDLQRKSEMTLQTFANSSLPQSVEHFHSLVALNVKDSKTPSTFGYPSTVYKATSKRDGHTYALRRIAGFRLNSEDQIRTINTWKRLTNSSLVTVHDAFTGRWFGDSSLIIVMDYHPCSWTLADKVFGTRDGRKHLSQVVPESELWGYIVQLTSKYITDHRCLSELAPAEVLSFETGSIETVRVFRDTC